MYTDHAQSVTVIKLLTLLGWNSPTVWPSVWMATPISANIASLLTNWNKVTLSAIYNEYATESINKKDT